MASNLVVVANKLKLMIEQTKIHSEAIKESAVTQAKIQAENEKAEVAKYCFKAACKVIKKIILLCQKKI